MVRASDWCTEGRRFKSYRGLRFFLCPLLVTCWTHHSSFLYRAFTISLYMSHSWRFRCSVGFPFWIFYRLIFKGHDKALCLLSFVWCSWTMWSSGHCESQGLTWSFLKSRWGSRFCPMCKKTWTVCCVTSSCFKNSQQCSDGLAFRTQWPERITILVFSCPMKWSSGQQYAGIMSTWRRGPQ